MAHKLKHAVCEANLDLVRRGLVFGVWGNASAIDREAGVVVIKPSGVPYHELTPNLMATVPLDGSPSGGAMRPSSDTAAHLVLYEAFPQIGAVVHTHSHYATCWAQALRPIPCLGTTHADYFRGEVPVTEAMSAGDIGEHYERNMGETIVHHMAGLDPLEHPAVLLANHGPFVWGPSLEAAVDIAAVLEEVARMAYHTVQLNWHSKPIATQLLDRHFLRKHGPDAYYGQRPAPPGSKQRP